VLIQITPINYQLVMDHTRDSAVWFNA